MEQPPSSATEPVGEPTRPIGEAATLTQGATAPLEPTAGPPERRRRRWWIVLLVVLGIVLVLALLAIARNRSEESATRSAGETATSVPSTVAPGGGSPGGGEVPSGGGSGEPAPAPGEPAPAPDSNGEVLPEAAALTAPLIDAHAIPVCQEIAPVDVAPCTVTIHWIDRATDETAYRVVVRTQKGGARIAQLAPDSTSYSTGAGVGDTVCFEALVVRGDETASSSETCVTTSLAA